MLSSTTVAVTRCVSYELGEVSRAVAEALSLLGGLEAFAREGQTVLLKPNLLSAKAPDTAAATHPAVVEAVAREVLRIGATPVIGDSPPFRGQIALRYEHLLRVTGMRQAADRLGIDTVSLDRPWREIEIGGKLFRKMPVAARFLDADVVISLPKLKTHELTAYTGAVKNVFGVVPGLKKSQLHLQAAEDPRQFAQMIVDIFGACRPTLSIMDAVIGMEGQGPTVGAPKEIGLILASADAVALDAVALEIVGIAPESVDTTRLAAEQGFGEARLERIEILGESLDGARVKGFVPSPTVGGGMSQVPERWRPLLRNQFVPMPRVRADRCVGCGDCAAVCAIGAMTLADHRGKRVARADQRTCIACYCCDEACPHGAIDVRKGWIGEIVKRTRRGPRA